jgi:hypothetical protein
MPHQETKTVATIEGFDIIRYTVKKENARSSSGKSFSKNNNKFRFEVRWGLELNGEAVSVPFGAARRLKDIKRLLTDSSFQLLVRNKRSEAISKKVKSLIEKQKNNSK